MQKRSDFKTEKMLLSAWLGRGSPLWPLMLLGFVMLLSGCHALPKGPCLPPEIPMPPVLQKQMPSQTYSASVESDFKRWERRLTDMPPMSKP